MISDFDSFLGNAFGEASRVLGAEQITHEGVSVDCVAGTAEVSKELRDSGFMEKCARTVTLTRANFETLAIGDRSVVELGGREFKVLLIEDDGRCPIVTVNLQKK